MAAVQPNALFCNQCYKSSVEDLKKCGKCRVVRYCSEECQRAAWKIHQFICGKEDTAQEPGTQLTLQHYRAFNQMRLQLNLPQLPDRFCRRPEDIARLIQFPDPGVEIVCRYEKPDGRVSRINARLV